MVRFPLVYTQISAAIAMASRATASADFLLFIIPLAAAKA